MLKSLLEEKENTQMPRTLTSILSSEICRKRLTEERPEIDFSLMVDCKHSRRVSGPIQLDMEKKKKKKNGIN